MRDEIIRMAKEAGFNHGVTDPVIYAAHERFYNLIVQHEREECAKLCDRFQARDVGMQPAECAGAIRARGEKQ